MTRSRGRKEGISLEARREVREKRNEKAEIAGGGDQMEQEKEDDEEDEGEATRTHERGEDDSGGGGWRRADLNLTFTAPYVGEFSRVRTPQISRTFFGPSTP